MKKWLKDNWINTSVFLSVLVLPIIVYADYGDAGFWSGLWQGVTFPFRIFLKLIWTEMTIYEQFNSTYWYHVGFFLGILAVLGGGSKATR